MVFKGKGCYITGMKIIDPALIRFRRALDKIYGDKLERVVLFGSRARGNARPDSDYDVAIFLKDMPDRWKELDRLADLRVTILEEDGPFFDALPYLSTTYKDKSMPLMHEIRQYGVDI